MRPMFLGEIEQAPPKGAYAGPIGGMRAANVPVPQIMHLFAYKPDRTDHLSAFTQAAANAEVTNHHLTRFSDLTGPFICNHRNGPVRPEPCSSN